MEQFEKELMIIFDCDPSWPICLYDFTYKNKIPNHFCFKVNGDFQSFLIEDYIQANVGQDHYD